MPSKTIEDFAYQIKDYMRSAEVVEGKNKLPNYCISGSESGITWVKYADGTVVLNGTAEADISIYIVTENNAFSLSAGQYYVSGCPDDINVGSNYVAQFILTKADGSQNYAIDNGTGVSWNSSADLSAIRARIKVFSGKTVSNAVFKPMICTASDWNKSHTYEPYYVPVKDRVDDLEYTKDDNASVLTNVNTSISMVTTDANDRIKRKGYLVSFLFEFIVNTEIPSASVVPLFTVPSDYIPLVWTKPMIYDPSGVLKPCDSSLRTDDGRCYALNTSFATGKYSITATYIAKNDPS